MSLESLYADGIEAGIQRQLQSPRANSGSDFRLWAALSAGAKGVPAGGLEAGGSALDFLAPAAAESARHPRPAVLADQPDDSARRAADLAFVKTGGPVMRAKAAEFMPDPTTSTSADQVLAGLGRIGGKAVAAVTAAGPIGGGALLGAEETNTQYRALIAKGIDPATALKTAGVQGAAAGLGVAVPMVGPTVASTLGLMAAAGPGTFMAQEALSKQILEKAGYHDEASLHNPTDPAGLALSAILPVVAGGVHIAGLARKPAPTLAEVVLGNESGGKRYGADGKLLTSPKGAQGEMQVMPGTATDPGYGVTPARDNSPDELARVGRDYLDAMQHRYGSPDLAMAAYNAGPGAVDKALNAHGADWLTHLPDETQKYVAKGMKKLGDQTVEHAASNPEAVDAARTRTTVDALNRSMPEAEGAHAEVARASDSIAAGEMPEVRELTEAEFNAHFNDGADPRADAASLVPEGRREVVHATVGGGDAAQGWADATRATGADERPATLYRGAERQLETADFQAESLGHATERPSAGLGVWFTPSKAEAATYGPAVEAAHLDLRNPLFIKADELPGFDSVAEATAWREKQRSAGYDGLMISAAHLGGKTHFVVFDPHQVVKPQPRASLGAAPGPRSEGSNTLPSPERVTIAAPKAVAAAEPVQSPAAQRVAEIAKESPDMPVQLPGSERTVTLAQAMKEAEAEHAMEASFADMAKAAIECAMSFGA